jgi:hypothetical protein
MHSHPHPLSIPQTTAWASDEQILSPDDQARVQGSSGKGEVKGIVVTQEIGIRSERMPGNEDPTVDWGFGSVKHDHRLSSA